MGEAIAAGSPRRRRVSELGAIGAGSFQHGVGYDDRLVSFGDYHLGHLGPVSA